MVLTGINSARRSAKSGKSATIRIRLSASGRTMNRSNSKDGRRRSSGAGLISSVRTMTNKRDKQRSNDAVLTSSDGFKRTRTDAGLIRSDKPRNNVATPNFSDAIRDRQMDGGLMTDAALIRSAKLKSN